MIRLEQVIAALPVDFAAMQAEARAAGFGMLDVLAAERPARTASRTMARRCLPATWMTS
jgi:hypothetical protein